MKIGIMSAWNSDSGASIHAEFIGREFVKMGHKIEVFSFIPESFHGTAIVDKDEPYVHRCFSTFKANPVFFDAVPFLREKYDIFLAEDIGMFPKNELGRIFHWIKKKAKTVTVVHDGKLTDDPSFYQFDWDGIVGFDRRYIDFLKEGYPSDILKYIPYPCIPWKPGNKAKARQKLKLPADRKIVFMFGPASATGAEVIPWLWEMRKEYPIHIVVVVNHQPTLLRVKPFAEFAKDMVEVRKQTLTVEEIYDYLHAADATVFNKGALPWVAVSSTIYQCLGAGCPFVARDSNFVEMVKDSVFLFRSFTQFRSAMKNIFDNSPETKNVLRNAKNYLDKNCSSRVASEFIRYFKGLLKK
ncbi:MAG: hypothetical protein JW728_01735 [Candidatus Aureabacteria bacterium]|nr:hypothetical protein [Candidatus Auribacterota bacterium]